MDQFQPFLLGVVATASAAVGAFFYRFWRRTRDRLFVAFAAAFGLMSANWAAQAFVPKDESVYAAIYLLRLAAFGVIIVGIIGKNRSERTHAPPPRLGPTGNLRSSNEHGTPAGVPAIGADRYNGPGRGESV